MLLPAYSNAISGLDVLLVIDVIPIPGNTFVTVPGLAVVLTVTAPVPPLTVTLPPALVRVTPEFEIVAKPTFKPTEIPAPAMMESIKAVNPGKSTVIKPDVLPEAKIFPVKSTDDMFVVNDTPEFNTITSVGGTPGRDQVLSPRKNCSCCSAVVAAKPVAESEPCILPVVTIGFGVLVKVIKSEEAVDIDVTVPILSA